MKRFFWLLVLCVASLAASAKQAACVLPPPDGANVDWSPPSVEGVLTQVGAARVMLRTKGGSDYSIDLSADTQLFTVYGGGFEPADLKVGQHAIIWLRHCAKPGKTNRAAVLQVCSLAPEPCPG